MDFLDRFDMPVKYLDESLGLIEPALTHSVAGILPELIRHWSIDLEIAGDLQSNRDFAKRLQETYSDGYESIIFFICDGIGAQHLSQMKGFLWENISGQGTIASTMFPSMTSTVMTSLSYGQLPSQHGLVGYNLFNEHIPGIWNALNLQYQSVNGPSLVLDRVGLDKLVEGAPIIDLVNQAAPDVDITFISPSELKSPSLLNLINPNVTSSLYSSPKELLELLFGAVSKPSANKIIAVYMGYADHFGHIHGPDSQQYLEGVRLVEHVIQQAVQFVQTSDQSIAMVMTSDHGQVQIDHSISHWMDLDEWGSLRDQELLLSTSGRVIHGYGGDDNQEKIEELLLQLAGERGLVIDNGEAMRLAGGDEKYSHRMGDYVMLMSDGYLYDIPEIVPYGTTDRLQGQHGSLTSKELFVPVGIF